MVRPTWSGSISFGLVTVPVRLYTAVRSHDVRFRQLHADTKAPVKRKRVDAETGAEVDRDDIVKGYEVADDEFVVVDPDEIAELDPRASRTIEIHDYVEQDDIDPIYYDRAYYLAPDGESAAKPYRLLTEAMQATGKVAIATFVMRNNEYLAAIRARDDLLLLSTMHYADEVADPEDLDATTFGGDVEIDDRERAMAEQLIESLLTDFDPHAYHDRHQERLLELLEAKAEGQTVDLPEPEGEVAEVVDLASALEQSLQRAGSRGDGRAASRSGDSGSGYASMTRDELYELAQQRDLPGRSGLSKSELVEALQADDEASGAA